MSNPWCNDETTPAPAEAVLAVAAVGLTRVAIDEQTQTPAATVAEVQSSLRCPTCQGLSVAGSPSPVAKAMRKEIRERVRAGQSADEVRDYFVARYGEWILLSPPRRGFNWLLWLLPGLGVSAGLALAVHRVRRGRPPSEVDEADLDHARAVHHAHTRAVHHAHTRGEYTPDSSAAGERIEAALNLLDSVDEEEPAGSSPDPAREEGLRRLAAALAAHRADSHQRAPGEEADQDTADGQSASAPPDQDPPPAQEKPRLSAAQLRMVSYGLALAAFALLSADLLADNLDQRGADGLPTGADQSLTPETEPRAGVRQLRQAAEERPKDPGAWRALGRALEAEGETGPAYNAYSRALELDPDHDETRRLTAGTLIRGGSPEEAVPLITPVVEDNPDDARTVLLLGLAQYGSEHPDADETLRRYLGLAPDGPAAEQVRTMLAD